MPLCVCQLCPCTSCLDVISQGLRVGVSVFLLGAASLAQLLRKHLNYFSGRGPGDTRMEAYADMIDFLGGCQFGTMSSRDFRQRLVLKSGFFERVEEHVEDSRSRLSEAYVCAHLRPTWAGNSCVFCGAHHTASWS